MVLGGRQVDNVLVRRLCAVVGVLAGGCYNPHAQPGNPCSDGLCPEGLVCAPATKTCELSAVDGGTNGDTGDTSMSLGDAAPGCYGTGIVVVCPAFAPMGSYVPSGPVRINTDTATSCAQLKPGSPNVCVIAATTIQISTLLTAVGSRPLVLLATGSIELAGQIDVASHRAMTEIIGAGADPMCMPGAVPTTTDGGPGGSFSGSGGRGGGAVASGPPVLPTMMRGGCRGAAGGGPGPGPGGHGGGAIFLIAGTSILVNGLINASGEGGGPGVSSSGGGGGGGAGGMIGFDAPMITLDSGLVIANGGGGGEGGTVGPSMAGSDPNVMTPLQPALGGRGSIDGGRGGNGSAGLQRNGGDGQTAFDASGGGGGGAGVILMYGNRTVAATLSPPPS